MHGNFPELEGGDLLIVAGDLTRAHTPDELIDFLRWFKDQKYQKRVFIAGNHDTMLEGPWHGERRGPFREDKTFYDFDYLCDSGTEFEGLKIWGSPWTKAFEAMNPKCKAFTLNREEDLAKKWALIPDDTHILITHSPPYGILDKTIDGECVGSKSLQMELFQRLRPQLFVCGHIHEGYGIEPPGGFIKRAVNASHVNESYQPVNKPIRVVL